MKKRMKSVAFVFYLGWRKRIAQVRLTKRQFLITKKYWKIMHYRIHFSVQHLHTFKVVMQKDPLHSRQFD